MQVKFNVFGKPRGKQRPRLCSVGGRNIVYTPKQTIEYEKLIKASYMATNRIFFEKDIPIEVNILAYCGEAPQQICNKDVCENIGKIARNEKYWVTKKPDSDNIIKIVLDALNKVAFYDDAQVSKICFEKRYSKMPRLEITIQNLKETKTNENN